MGQGRVRGVVVPGGMTAGPKTALATALTVAGNRYLAGHRLRVDLVDRGRRGLEQDNPGENPDAPGSRGG